MARQPVRRLTVPRNLVNSPMTDRIAFIGLGANLGDARMTLRAALQALSTWPEISECTASPFYRTAPVDANGPDFINAVARLRTTLTPEALLATLQSIENSHGRTRSTRNAPRTLDLDLLWFEGETRRTEALILPHPRMHLRAFVLRPLLDLAPAFSLQQGPVSKLLLQCEDQPIDRL